MVRLGTVVFHGQPTPFKHTIEQKEVVFFKISLSCACLFVNYLHTIAAGREEVFGIMVERFGGIAAS